MRTGFSPRALVCVVFIAVFGLHGCDQPHDPAPETDQGFQPEPTPRGEVVATFGDSEIGAAALREELMRLSGRSRKGLSRESQRRFVENLILQELVFAIGVERGLDRDPAIQRQLRDQERRLVVQRVVAEVKQVPEVGDTEVAAYYDENQRRYSTTTVRARHILMKDRAAAEAVHAQALAAPETFAALAGEHSEDAASARTGGDLGFFGHGRMAPAFEEAAFALDDELAIADLVETPYGFHVIQLVEKRPGKQRPLSQVGEQIRSLLLRRAVDAEVRAFYRNLRDEAAIEVDTEAVARVVAALPEPSPGVHRGMGGH
jgi:peptidyl-prolyl cis-trans isomerase C